MVGHYIFIFIGEIVFSDVGNSALKFFLFRYVKIKSCF
jgi:hypothetical protein